MSRGECKAANGCDDPTCACRQLAWMEEMERIEQEVFPDARPRSEVVVEVETDA